MSTPIRVPELGESIREGVIARWLKAEGEAVRAHEPLVEVETDKITVEVPAPESGVLLRQAVSEGETVAVGALLGEIGEGEAQPASEAAEKAAPKQEPAAAPKREKAEAKAASEAKPTSDARPASEERSGNGSAAGPAVRAEATRLGVDLSSVSGTGRGGRIQKEDVQRAAKPAPAAAPASPRSEARPDHGTEERKPMSALRKRVAERLLHAQQTAAILTTFNEVDMSAVMALRQRFKDGFAERHGVKLGFMSFFVRAAVEALIEFPGLNAEIDGDEIVYKYHYDVGVAVGGGKGLVVPVLRDADRKGFAEVEREIAALADKAKNNKLTLEELTGGTFTISNGGVYGSMLSTPILNPPQTGILGLHNIVERPVAIAGKVEIRPVMYLALSYDHRLVDGREAVQFLVAIKHRIEEPERLLLQV